MKSKKLTVKTIIKLQDIYGFTDLQNNINSGLAWKLEGFYGRTAMSALESGACMLPLDGHYDYYGNIIPNRNILKNGTKGTLGNSQLFWQKVEDGEILMNEDVEEEIA